jgi:hypothetical protein
MIKKAFDIENLNSSAKERIRNQSVGIRNSSTGVGGNKLAEPLPKFISTNSEKVISGENNAAIVLGRDRVGSRLSGYGGKGHTQCGAIDIVCGRMGANVTQVDEAGNPVYVDPNFKIDAARIYISQKTDIDASFELVPGSIGNPKARSGIAMKADGIRLIGREGIKLITRTDKRNSQGGQCMALGGIDLIAGNDDSDLQPIPKGDNLLECLTRIVHHLDSLNGIVDHLLMVQNSFNKKLTSHFHISPFLGIPTSPSESVMVYGAKTMLDHATQTKTSLASNKANVEMMRNNYLNVAGSGYINSRHNNTN